MDINNEKSKNDLLIDFILNEVDERRALDINEGFGIDDIVVEFTDGGGKNAAVSDNKEIAEAVEAGEYNGINVTEDISEKLISLKEVYDWAESIAVSVLSIMLVMTFLFRMNEVFGISMQPTLFEGDRLIVLPLLNGPEFGDIVVVEAMNLYNSTTGELGEPIVKRVIGVAGDTIFIDAETGDVYRNGELLNEEYIAEKINIANIGNQMYPLTIKENEVFVMGDNRNHSTDSRFAEGYLYYVDCVGIEYVLGKAVLKIWPPERIGGFYNSIA